MIVFYKIFFTFPLSVSFRPLVDHQRWHRHDVKRFLFTFACASPYLIVNFLSATERESLLLYLLIFLCKSFHVTITVPNVFQAITEGFMIVLFICLHYYWFLAIFLWCYMCFTISKVFLIPEIRKYRAIFINPDWAAMKQYCPHPLRATHLFVTTLFQK